MFNTFLHRQCQTLANCFVLAGRDNWGSHNFIDQLFHTEWGQNILTGKSVNEYTCEGFMYEGLERYLKKRRGKVYPEKVLWYCGYLYRYAVAESGRSLEEIYERISIDIIEKRYGFYHTQDWDYVIEDLFRV